MMHAWNGLRSHDRPIAPVRNQAYGDPISPRAQPELDRDPRGAVEDQLDSRNRPITQRPETRHCARMRMPSTKVMRPLRACQPHSGREITNGVTN